MKLFDNFLNKRIFKLLNSKGFSFSGSFNALEQTFPQLFTNKETYNSFVYACVNKRAEKVSTADIYIYDGDREIENPDSVEYKLFKTNNLQKLSFCNILYYISASLDLYGKAYLIINRNNLNVPISFQIVFPNYVKEVKDPTNTVVLNYELNTINGTLKIPVENMLYFYLPDMKIFGGSKSTVDALKDVIEINTLRTSFQKNFLSNNARIDGVLQSTNQMTDEQFKRLSKQWNSKYSGSSNSGKTPILEGGLSYIPTQSNSREMDFVNSVNMIRDEILTVFGVPKFILGISESGDSRSNGVNAMRNFMENIIIPFARQHIFSVFDSFLKDNYRPSLKLMPDYSLEEDPAILKSEVEMLLNTNTISRNEARGLYKWDKISNPDFDNPDLNNKKSNLEIQPIQNGN
jgi:HK97 family phage portal protein